MTDDQHLSSANAEDLRELVESPQEFTRLVAALVRSSLADTHKQVLEDAAR